MTSLLLVLLGTGLVIGVILGLRLHAFLALIGAALIVVTATPETLRLRSTARPQAAEVTAFDDATSTVQFSAGTAKTLKSPGAYHIIAKHAGSADATTVARLDHPPDSPQSWHSDHPLSSGDLLVAEADWPKIVTTTRLNPGEVVAQGFGNTTASIGLIIALASVIGACLMESGGAERIVQAMRRLLGEKHTALAFVPSGFLLCIPAFFETVFYLLIPLGKALRKKTGRDYLLYILAIIAGATMAQSLVPPTPGPLFVADAFHIKIGTMMLAGAIVGLLAAAAGYTFALWANRRWDIPLRDTPTTPSETPATTSRPLPSLLWSLVPIVLPISLIVWQSFLDEPGAASTPVRRLAALLGNKNIALALGALSGLLLLAQRLGWNWRALGKPLNHALEGAGLILLITPAGGAFGYALRATDIGGLISDSFTGSRAWLLPAAFCITMFMRLAQGSATVAMITGAGIIAPVAAGLPLPYHPIYLALAIGCGSKPVSWMNDSGFWIISRMTGMTEAETLRTMSVMMGVMGFAGFGVTMLGAWLLPFV